MDKAENILTLEKELENLREKLNNEVDKNIRYTSKEEYENLVSISRKLDDTIVSYIISYNQ